MNASAARLWRILPAAALLLAIALAAPAQSVPPTLVVDGDPRRPALGISRVDVEVRILGFVAETHMTLVFRNGLDRPLGGDLYFPLPSGATVSGYALDVQGAMVDGVAVEKDKARQVFEKEMRKGVDPGLVEWTRGNHFKTRVFPVPARGTRTVRISYLSELAPDATGSRYRLPLNFTNRLAQFHLRVEVVKGEDKPVIHRGPALEFGKWRDGLVAETHASNTPMAKDLILELPRVERQRVLVEKASDGQFYFCLNEFPADPRPKETPLRLPALGQVTIFWDASGSRAGTGHQRELGFLKSWFAAYARQTVAVNLVPFRNTLDPVQRFVVTNGEIAALAQAISRLAYDGGTQLGGLTNFPAPAPGGCYFLFSDGLGNFGKTEPPAFDAPLFAFGADQVLDQPFLQNLAQRSGGAYFNLQRLTDPQVLAAMAAQPFAFLGLDGTGGGVSDVYPQGPRPIEGRLTVVGKLSGTTAQPTLDYGAGGKSLARSKPSISRADAVPGDLLRRFWAQQKLQELLVFQERNRDEITELGRQCGLVTPYTSLMVLETLDQYVEHRILPPVSLPKLRADYARVVEEKGAVQKREEREKTEHLLAMWKERVEWWNRKFAFPKNFKYQESDEKKPSMVTGLPAAPAGEARPMYLTPLPSGAPPAEAAGAAAFAAPAQAMAGGAYEGWAEDHNTLAAQATQPTAEPGIAIKEWDPKTPYIEALKKAQPGTAFATYLAQRPKYRRSPAFYLDCAEFFRRQQQAEVAIQVFSNIAELDLENAALLRVLAYRLLQIGQTDLACRLFEQVLTLRPEEPQSFRDLALALARRGLDRKDPADCRRAAELLGRVIKQDWDRFDAIEVIALMELNALWSDFTRQFPNEKAEYPVDSGLKQLLDLDLRIVLTWDADMTDMDLHVIEPSGERAFYEHDLTTIGGLVSRDFTQGYGPEEYCLRKALTGTYRIEVNYYGSQATQLMGPATVQAEVITHFGRPNEKRKSLTLRLDKARETTLVGEVEF